MPKTLIEIAQMTEIEARTYLEGIIWPDGPVCPHCGSVKVTRLHGNAHRAGAFQCNDCREQFTVTVGSIMEDSHIPLTKWVLAFHLLCSSKKGFSAKQLQRELNLGSYRTAWHMMHRIREAMTGPVEEAMQGLVEMDETYVGGKPRKGDGEHHKRGAGTDKAPVIAVVSRSGVSHAEPVLSVTTKAVKSIAQAHIAGNAVVATDEAHVYDHIDKHFADHVSVNHGDGEYAKYEKGIRVHTNTVQSYFSLLKRGHYGVYHSMSFKHLARYCEEFSFRWDHRKVNDGKRTEAAIAGATGKRLMYRDTIADTSNYFPIYEGRKGNK